MFFFPIFSCCSKSGYQAQEDSTKSNYKTNRKIKNLGILLHVGKPLEPIRKISQFKRKKLKICPNPPKILPISQLFSLKYDNFFGNFSKKSLEILLGIFLMKNNEFSSPNFFIKEITGN
jgi:hypothetical protein